MNLFKLYSLQCLFLMFIIFSVCYSSALQAGYEFLKIGLPIISQDKSLTCSNSTIVESKEYETTIDYWNENYIDKNRKIKFIFLPMEKLEACFKEGFLDIISHYDYNKENKDGIFSLPWGEVSWFLNSPIINYRTSSVKISSIFGAEPININKNVLIDFRNETHVLSDYNNGYLISTDIKSTLSILISHENLYLLEEVNKDIINGSFYDLTESSSIKSYEKNFVDDLNDINISLKVANSPVINIGLIKEGAEPYFINRKISTIGLSIDIVNYEMSRLAIKYKYIDVENFDDYIRLTKNKELDYIPTIFKTNERSSYLGYSNVYFSTEHVIVAKDVDIIENKKSKRIALISGMSYSNKVMMLMGLEHDYIYFDNYELAIRSVLKGDVDLFVGNNLQVLFNIKKLDAYRLGIANFNSFDLDEPIYNAMLKSNYLYEYYSRNKHISEYKDSDLDNKIIGWRSFTYSFLILREKEIIKSNIKIVILLLIIITFAFFTNRKAVFRFLGLKGNNSIIANVSHEIRMPLSSINGLIELYLENYRGNTSVDSYNLIHKISNAIDKVMVISDDILSVDKCNNESSQVNYTNFDAFFLLKNVCDLFLYAAKGNNIDLILNFEGEGCNLTSDEVKLFQIFNNLVSNAIKFSSNNEVIISLNVNYKEAIFSIEDFGIGIEDSKLSMIFEPFSQADKSISKDFGGAGLGLSVVKDIVNSLGGDITVESEIGIRTKFSIRLPNFVKIQNNTIDNVSFKSELLTISDFSEIKVIVIDDDPLSLHITKGLLYKLGCHVTSFTNALIALDYVKCNQDKCHVIICDCYMPIINGYDFVRECKLLNLDIPIISLTADSTKYNEFKCKNVGFDLILIKPITENKLKLSLIELIEKKVTPEEEDDYFRLLSEYGYECTSSEFSVTKNNVFLEKDVSIIIFSLNKYINELSVAISSKDFNCIKMISHRLKISCLYMNILDTAKLFKSIDEDIHDDVAILNLGVKALYSLESELSRLL